MLQSYFETFQNNLDIIKHIGGVIGEDPIIYKKEEGTNDNDKMVSHQRYMATAFISGADCKHFGMLLDKLQNDYLQGYNKYPRMLAAAFYLLVN